MICPLSRKSVFARHSTGMLHASARSVPRCNRAITRPSLSHGHARQISIDPKRSPRVLIVGGGVSGLTLALSLHERGIRSDIVDQVQNKLSDGVYLPISAMQVFKDLDLDTKLTAHGAPIRRFTASRNSGFRYGRVNLGQLGAKLAGTQPVGIDYVDLVKVLHEAVKDRTGREPTHSPLLRVKQTDKAVHATFKGRQSGVYDLVVGADGFESKVRELAFDKVQFKIQQRPDKWGFYSTVISRPPGNDSSTFNELWGKGGRFWMLPVSAEKLFVWGSTNSAFPVERLRGGLRPASEFIDAFKERYTGLNMPRVLDTIEKENLQCELSFPHELKMKTWVNGRIVLIGDAAHQLMPNLPLNTALAVEDAHTLAHCIASDLDDTDRALTTFMKMRYPRVYNLQRESWAISKDGQASGAFRVFWRVVKMIATHSTPALVMREKRIAKSGVPLLPAHVQT